MRVSAAIAMLVATTCGFGQNRPKLASVSHLSVYSSDAAKTERFYVHDLGALKGTDPQNPAGTRYYFNPIQFVEVLSLPASGDPKSRFDHAGFDTADAEAMRKYLGAHGVAVPATVSRASNGSQYFEVKDPEGNRIEFVQPGAGQPSVPDNPLSKHIIHVGFIVHDRAAEDAFYIGLLGFRPYWHGGPKDDGADWISMQLPDGSDWIEYMMVKGPEKTGIPAAMTQDTAGVLNHFALGVQNMERRPSICCMRGDRLNGEALGSQDRARR